MEGENLIPNYLKKELNILFFIIKRNATSLNEITKIMGIPKRTVKEKIKRINNTYMEYLSIENFIISTNSGTISIHSDYRKEAVKYAYTLKLHLLKTITLFNYCVLLVTNFSIKKELLIEQMFISENYLTRLTQQLNAFLANYDIHITTDNGHYFLEGNELNIRLFSYLFLQDSFQDLEWPFQNITMENIRRQVPEEILQKAKKKSHTKNRSLYILYAVLQTRIGAQHFLKVPADNQLKSLLELFKKNFDVALIFHKNPLENLPQSKKESEIIYFNFLARIFISDIIPRAKKANLGRAFFKQDHPECLQSKAIYNKITSLLKEPLTEEKKYLYIYYITLFNALYRLIGDHLLAFIALYIPNPNFYLQTDNSYFTSIKTSIAPLLTDDNQLTFLSNVLYFLTISEKKSQLKIYLQMTKDFTAIYFVKNQLSALYNAANIFITDDYAQADIIVTDTLEQSTNNKEIFYLDSIGNTKSWNELTTLILQKYLAKIQQDDTI